MSLKIAIKGLRFRATDKTNERLGFVSQRIAGRAVKLRAGDNPADLAEILSRRQPLSLWICGTEMGENKTGLKVAIRELRFRATDKANERLELVRQRLASRAVKLRAGDNPADLAEILSRRQPLNLEISMEPDETAEIVMDEIKRPEMIDDPRLPFRVAKGVVRRSLPDGRELAAEINKQNPGSKLRIPTEAELLKLNKLLGNQLEGTAYYIWTETEHEDLPGEFVLRQLGWDYRYSDFPDRHALLFGYAVRFIEDK